MADFTSHTGERPSRTLDRRTLLGPMRALFSPTVGRSQVAPSMLSNISEQSNNSALEATPTETKESARAPEPIRVTAIKALRRLSYSRPTSATGPGTSGNSQKSNRSLIPSHKTGTTHRHGGARRRSVTRMELENGVKLVKRNLFSRKPWRDGLFVMGIVVSNTLSSLTLGWGVAFLYAMGSPFAPFYPTFVRSHSQQQQSRSESNVVAFYSATGLYFMLFACLAYLLPVAVLTSRRVTGFSDDRTVRPQGFRLALLRRVQATWVALVVALCAGVAFMALLAWQKVRWRVHLYGMCAIAYSYAQFASHRMQSLQRARTREIRRSLRPPRWPPTRPNVVLPHRTRAPLVSSLRAAAVTAWSESVAGRTHADARAVTPPRRSAGEQPFTGPPARMQPPLLSYRRQHLKRVALHVVLFHAVFGYLHVASSLALTEQWELALFACASLALKTALQEATKRFQLRGRSHRDSTRSRTSPSTRAVHLAMTVPTLAIDAQIRMVFLQSSTSSGSKRSVVASSVAIVVGEVFFRVAKIVRLRVAISKRLAGCTGLHRLLKRVNSKLAVRDVTAARAEYTEFLDWKNLELRVHAAEVFADMHGEYISIGLSTAVALCLGDGHPMFDCVVGGGSSSSSSSSSSTHQVLVALFQMGTGLAFDYLSSVVEAVHEVPLYESIADEGAELRRFLHVLLATLTGVDVGVTTLFFLKPP